ncbi:ABC transporter permease [Nocardioides sp. JQ2195]|uniref:ABC transporter permease n=1 Tax=Nocardioides sp. JQ2195 TaxID=2592334 RepID=UPI00143EABE0|nr:ABC transporter permease [Nocardioides sp. JQ2195]QIX26904.1 ABC transporter permease [Nocardioides sp. JQ2195]
MSSSTEPKVGGEAAQSVVDTAAPVTSVASKSPMQLAMGRLRKDKLSLIALGFVLFFVLAGLTSPLAVHFGWIDPLTTHLDLTDEFGRPTGKWGGMSSDHLLGIEPGIGRDTLARLWSGVSLSLFIALSGTALAMILGVVLGIVSGVAGGWTDAIIGRIIDLTLAFPQTLMLLALASTGLIMVQKFLHTPAGNPTAAVYLIVVLGLFGWTGIARIVRGQVLSLREREFVHAATMMGASKFRLYFREILPNLWAPILVTFTLMMPAFVSAEAALAYLGVGINAPTPTLGNILNASISYADVVPTFFFIPGFTIAAIVVSFNLLGDGIRDALDPKGHQ